MILRLTLVRRSYRTYAYAANIDLEYGRQSRTSSCRASAYSRIAANEKALPGSECIGPQATQRPADADEWLIIWHRIRVELADDRTLVTHTLKSASVET